MVSQALFGAGGGTRGLEAGGWQDDCPQGAFLAHEAVQEQLHHSHFAAGMGAPILQPQNFPTHGSFLPSPH